ncbi:hypothetical protein L226DRAFT_302290 [Lentinus tigrinus ALCF2SS1-7]|uniref:Uncharacterized protein n=1 Tax=Lentinus tigrinus ALCF2SS1-6 TaxID=1328759 RepID=A0A5C2S2D0_9APHY|nr:hypothetical protein L227DRAFT_226994 [Lentinus tigrinus ALCF2SS1-6]RPD78795.1 hypothetical protein L226DRAFT_302290 [Lentinus tigrinus ALCF2SS1-7]
MDNETPEVTSALLDRLSLPSLEEFGFQLNTYDLGTIEDPFEDGYLSSAFPLPLHSAPSVPFWHELTSAGIHAVNGPESRQVICADSSQQKHAIVIILNHGEPDGMFNFDLALRDFVALFGGSPINTLILSGDYDSLEYADTMPMLFRALPELRILYIQGLGEGDGLRALWDAFRPITVERSESPDAANTQVKIPCPQLRSVMMGSEAQDVTFMHSPNTLRYTEGFFAHLKGVLSARASHGVQPLEKLELHLSCRKGTDFTMARGAPESVLDDLVDWLHVEYTEDWAECGQEIETEQSPFLGNSHL